MRKLFLGATAAVAVAASAPAFAAATIYYQPVTAPTGAAWIPDGTTAKGHLWLADHLSGLCRLNPGGASPTASAPLSNCILIGAAGQFAYDPVTVAVRLNEAATATTFAADSKRHFVYYTDLSSKSNGSVTRLTFNSPTATLTTARKVISV